MKNADNEHRHSRIKFVTPAQRHNGEDKAILAKRRELYKKTQEKTPNRWSKGTSNWDVIGDVELNPENKKKLLNSLGDNT